MIGLLLQQSAFSLLLAITVISTPVNTAFAQEVTRFVETLPRQNTVLSHRIEVDRSAFTVWIFAITASGERLVMADSVAIGIPRYPTPAFSSKLGAKRHNPAWNAPNRPWAGRWAGRAMPWSSKDNPFRATNENGGSEGYFVHLGHGAIGIHTTKDIETIGTRASHGCIRTTLRVMRYIYYEVTNAAVIVR